MFSFLSNGPDHKIVEDGERTASGVRARSPIKRPEEITTKGGSCKQALILLDESDKITRLIQLFKKDLAERYVFPEPSVGGEAEKRDLMGLYADATVEQYLNKHPEDAHSFGLNGYRPEGERAILKQSLVQYLMEKPEVGYRLGDKALTFRIRATLTNLERIDKDYKDLLKKLPELKKRKENGFPLWARAYHRVRHGLNKSLWWVRDNPKGLMAVSSLIVLLKLGVVLFFIYGVEFGHKEAEHGESGHRKKKSTHQSQPAQAYRPQPPPYPQQYGPQPYYPQQYSSPQAPVFPAPYFDQSPMPLQIALSMPTT